MKFFGFGLGLGEGMMNAFSVCFGVFGESAIARPSRRRSFQSKF